MNQEPALEVHSRAASSVEAHHCDRGPTTVRNYGGRHMMKKNPLSLVFSQTVAKGEHSYSESSSKQLDHSYSYYFTFYIDSSTSSSSLLHQRNKKK